MEPWNFPGDAEEERYFFCRIKKEVKSGGSSAGVRKRVVGASGYWKLTGTEKQIITLPLKAIKSRFLFCDGGGEDQEEEEDDDDEEGGGGGSTNVAQAEPKWIMHEFRPQYQGNQIERDQWAAYRVFQKKPKGPKGRVICLRSSSQRLLNRLYDRA
ncbi:hypothetical protein BT93_I1074 [Corymbia citriodora subsp. variegata]|nr:hypothetical protein BT93_I1074 [Corymbia citriodora subsp. variegata]